MNNEDFCHYNDHVQSSICQVPNTNFQRLSEGK